MPPTPRSRPLPVSPDVPAGRRSASAFRLAVPLALALGVPPALAPAQARAGIPVASILLYSNDFETPNQAIVINCGNSLDITPIQTLYGTAGFTYNQINTVEAVSIADSQGLYSDPEGNGRRVLARHALRVPRTTSSR